MSSPTDTQRNELVTIQEEATMDGQITGNTIHQDVIDANVPNPNTTNDLQDPSGTENKNGTSLPARDNGGLNVTGDNKQDQISNNKTNGGRHDSTVDVNTDTAQLRPKECFTEPISRKTFGLFAYFPQFLREICLTPYGVLFFLCWASTMQVNLKQI